MNISDPSRQEESLISSSGLTSAPKTSPWLDRFLNGIEYAGNKLPDSAILFLIAMLVVWVLSAFFPSLILI